MAIHPGSHELPAICQSSKILDTYICIHNLTFQKSPIRKLKKKTTFNYTSEKYKNQLSKQKMTKIQSDYKFYKMCKFSLRFHIEA